MTQMEQDAYMDGYEVNKRIVGRRIRTLRKKMNLDQNALSEMLNISRLKLAIAEEGGDCENLARIADESIRFAIYQLEDIQDAIDDIKEALKLDVIVTDEGDALRARIDEYKRITNMRNNEVCELNDLVLKKSNEIDELKKELGYVKAHNEDLKEDELATGNKFIQHRR